MINVIQDGAHAWEVWTDTDIAERDGRCLGSHDFDKRSALLEAFHELQTELKEVERQLAIANVEAAINNTSLAKPVDETR